MGKAGDIIRRSQERVYSSQESQKKEAETLKKIEDSRDHLAAKLALSDSNSNLDKQGEKELKKLVKETKKTQTTWQERHNAKVDYAMSKSSRDRESPPKSICFIATAIYGDTDTMQLEELRRYRDEVISKSMTGRKFIDFYYGGFGEKAADFIKEKIPRVIPVMRKCLDYVVGYIKSSKR